MEFLNRPFAQLAELFRSLTPGARIMSALLLVATCVSVAYLFREQSGAGDVYLLAGESFSAAQLRDMQAAFGKAGLEAQIDGARIKIPSGQEARYMSALADADALPAEFGHYMHEAVNTNSFLRVGHSQQEAAWRVARQQDLQQIIGDMHGIERAAVQIDEGRSDDFPRGKKSMTAAVMVRPEKGATLDERTAATIRQMVVSSVFGLEPSAVTVVDLSTNRHYDATAAAPATAAPSGEYAEHKKRHELQWKQTISEVLSYVPDVLVSTSVELAPGAEAPQRVSVSVAVPNTYYEQVWRREHAAEVSASSALPDVAALADLEMREQRKIEQLVANLLPASARADADARVVAVSTFYPVTNTPATADEVRERALAWAIANWRPLSLGLLALVGLLVLRSMVRSLSGARAAEAAPGADTTPALALVGDDFEEPAPQPTARSTRPARGAMLSGELAAAVRNDPEAAASVLRTWIGNAS